jgi:hypothetical protein
MEYIFTSDRLYPVDRSLDTDPGGGIMVDRDTLICYDVVDVGVSAAVWEFSVHGKEGRFRTHYDWSLVENTPENVARLKTWRWAIAFADEATRNAANLFRSVSKVPERK